MVMMLMSIRLCSGHCQWMKRLQVFVMRRIVAKKKKMVAVEKDEDLQHEHLYAYIPSSLPPTTYADPDSLTVDDTLFQVDSLPSIMDQERATEPSKESREKNMELRRKRIYARKWCRGHDLDMEFVLDNMDLFRLFVKDDASLNETHSHPHPHKPSPTRSRVDVQVGDAAEENKLEKIKVALSDVIHNRHGLGGTRAITDLDDDDCDDIFPIPKIIHGP
mmetsp:Transcript_13878/g.20319  ORF Transcript_13878/g.20319 Transcript_13878/m.20319 type:complete len:219 (+) Transcript_13878:126-782(+)